MSFSHSFPAIRAGGRLLIASLVLAGLASAPSFAQTAIDNTCASCERRQLDSLNYHAINPIRVNQVGYRTQEIHKVAFVASTSATPPASTYSIVDAVSGTPVWSGSLVFLGRYDSLKARMLIKGYYNSINVLYTMGDSTSAPQAEYLWKADFGGLAVEGTYQVKVGNELSHSFGIRETIYNDVFETALKFFGAQRCGATHSWFHKDCHTKDGSALGHEGELQGGWHDCGDHGKYGETEGYAASVLALAYAAMPEKAEDRYGESYNDTIPFGNDGIPDLLWEAKVGADYIYRLYNRSKLDGLVAKGDMYHTVGHGPGMDHLFWDRPEYQDAQAQNKGGPDRPVLSGIGTNVAGMFVVSLALVGNAWEPFDPAYSKQMVDAAVDIYDNIIKKNLYKKTATKCCYDGGGQLQDDPAFAAVALWYATGESRFGYDLYQNKALGTNSGSVFNVGEFAAGLLSRGPITGAVSTTGYFDHGGWTTDFQQTNQLALYAFGKLILKDTATSRKYGIDHVLRDSLLLDVVTGLKRGVSIGSNGSDGKTFPGINVDQPYHGVFTSAGWGFNRYNMGMVTELFMYWDVAQRTKFWQSMKGKTVPGRLARSEVASFVNGWSEAVDSMYLNVGVDNLNYQLGVNPWDMSFIMGAGSRNLQHPHNRAANPEGYNAGGVPYKYKVPKGALMGGCKPGALLKDYWLDYTVTETCIDFSSQLILPTQMLAKDLPPDTVGPEFQNVLVVDLRDTSALVTWQTNELSRDTLFYSLTPGGPAIGRVPVNLAKSKSAFLPGLTPKTTYYFWFKGMDIYRNVSRDDNRGRYYQFTTLDQAPPAPKIYDIRVCNIRADRATVFWWTDVVSSSSIEYAVEGTNFGTTKIRIDGDDEGIPGRFHKVTLKNLKPGTAYRFDVISGSAKDDSAGLHHRFETTQDFADYSIMMKATTKNKGGADFYLLITNNEPRPYAGLELRVYFKAPASVAKAISMNGTDNAIWGGGGGVIASPNIKFDSARAYGTSGDVWYLPIIIKDTIPVSGSVRVELKMDSTNWKPVSFSAFADGWSFAPHTAPPDPRKFDGIDMANPWEGPEQIETRNGVNYPTYVDDPYITAHYKGVHIYGYPPDGAKPRVFRTTQFTFTGPKPSPATSVKQDSVGVHFGGRTWSFPDVVNGQWQADAPLVRPSTPLAGRTDSVSFRHDTLDAQGSTSHEFAFWGDRDSSYCSCAWQRYTVVVDTQKAVYTLRWSPDSAKTSLVGTRVPYVLTLNDSTRPVTAAASIALVSSNPFVSFYTSATGGAPVTSLTMVGGAATVWVTSDSSVSNVLLTASGSSSGAVVVPAVSKPLAFALQRYRLVWTPDSSRSSLVGSRLAYDITAASDSLALEPVSGTVSLVSSKPGVVFYPSAAATVPVTSLALVAGKASVWVSALAPVDSAALVAAGTVVAATVDPDTTRWVSFHMPPPWPMMDSARTRDADCDGAVDHVEMFLSMKPGTSRFVNAVAMLGTDTAKGAFAWNTDSTVLALALASPIPGTALRGNATIWWNAVATGNRDTLVAVQASVSDRVGPRIVSASVLENFRPATVPDTLQVEFSEPVRAPASGWPFAAVLPVPPALANGKAITPTLWQWTIGPAAAVTVTAGQILRGGADGTLSDTAGNPGAGCGTDSATVQLRTRPVPLKAGAVVDLDGDGRADAVHLVYERGLRATEMPDSVRVSWGGIVASFPASAWTRGTDSSNLSAAILPQWAASADPSAKAAATKGVGAARSTDSVTLADSVGPSLVAAVLRFGTTHDTLLVRVNESSAAGAGIELSRLQSPLAAAISQGAVVGGTVPLVYPAGSLQDGDSVRLTAVWRDAVGNAAAPAAPWVAVVSGDRPPVDAWLRDSDGDGRADLVHLRWDRAFKRRHAYVFTWPSAGAWAARSSDTTDFVAMGALDAEVSLRDPFPFGATGLEGNASAPARQIESVVSGWIDSLAFSVRDSVDPVVVSAEMRYAATDGDLDTLVARFSEPLIVTSAPRPVVLHVQGPRHAETPVIHGAIFPSPDGRTILFQLNPMDSSHTAFARGDSVRIAPALDATVTDIRGNIAAGASPWAKISFGARPSRFKISMHPNSLHLSPSGTVPDPEQLQVLVRPRGAAEWYTLDGAPAGNTAGRIGPMIACNGGFGGRVHIYDNMGVSVAAIDLALLEQAFKAGFVPTDPSGQYEVWVSWNGASRTGKMVGSGVYMAHVILRRNIAADGMPPTWVWTNDLMRFGWKISIN